MKMKRFIHISVLHAILAAGLLLASCVRDDILPPTAAGGVEPGIPTKIDLAVAVADHVPMTRAAQSPETERIVNEIAVLAFAGEKIEDSSGTILYEAGDRISVSLFTNLATGDDTEGEGDGGSDGGSDNGDGTLTLSNIDVVTGADVNIYLAANYTAYGADIGALLQELDSEPALQGYFTTLSGKDGTQIDTDNAPIERNFFLMTGAVSATVQETETTTETGGKKSVLTDVRDLLSGESYSDNVIRLQRVDARITFNIRVASTPNKSDKHPGLTPNGNKYNKTLRFEPSSYAVYNVPLKTYIVPRKAEGGPEDSWDAGYDADQSAMAENFGKIEGQNYDKVNITDDRDNIDPVSTFEFYLFENRPPAKKTIAGNTEYSEVTQRYALRAKKEGSVADPNAPDDRPFEFAPEYATYVKFSGTLSYEENGEYRTAEVTYTVLLGAAVEPGGNMADANLDDYSTERNHHYTYNITLRGVNDMIVEVVGEDGTDAYEKRPDVEGDVYISSGEVKTMDCHYGQFLFQLSRKDIQEGNMFFIVDTPYTPNEIVQLDDVIEQIKSGTDPGDIQLPDGLNTKDYKWVKFGINSEFPAKRFAFMDSGKATSSNGGSNYSDEYMLQFPGEGAYDGGTTLTGTPWSGSGAYENKEVRLYDIYQLLARLYSEASEASSTIFDAEGKVTITAFVDEYLYAYDPRTGAYKAPNNYGDAIYNGTGNGSDMWQTCVQGGNRTLSINTSRPQYSDDWQTSLSRPLLSITQKPIQTIYNGSAPSGFGVECIEEQARKPIEVAWGNKDAGIELLWKPASGLPYDDSYINYSTTAATLMNYGLLTTRYMIRPQWGAAKHWADYVSLDPDAPYLREGNQYVINACLLRNRDHDGDGVIDAEEIVWYIASANELVSLWIGDNAITENVFYPSTRIGGFVQSWSTRPYHYATVSFKGADYSNRAGNPYIVYAERGGTLEGLSGEQANFNLTLNQRPYPQWQYYGYKVLRTLGKSIPVNNPYGTNIGKYDLWWNVEPERTVHQANIEYHERVIDLRYLKENCFRQTMLNHGEVLPRLLTNHNASINNRPYRKFAYIVQSGTKADGVYGPSQYSVYFNQEETQLGTAVSGSFYRIPCGRELQIMIMANANQTSLNMFPAKGYPYMAKTHWYTDLVSIGFFYDRGSDVFRITKDDNKSQQTSPGTDKSVVVRPVRDVNQ